MTDNELIDAARLAWSHAEGLQDAKIGQITADDLLNHMADRVEALVKERDALITSRDTMGNLRAQEKARAERLETLLREARVDLEYYVTQEYPKSAHPYFGRQWDRDMELCRRIDAALKGDDHE